MSELNISDTDPKLKIISGGQSGADRGGLEAAIELGLLHGGYCPKGRLSEDGPIPSIYQLEETDVANYTYRTQKNILASDITLIFTLSDSLTGGSLQTENLCHKYKKPVLHINLSNQYNIEQVSKKVIELIRTKFDVITNDRPLVINVAGNRESKAPGIYYITYQFVKEMIMTVYSELVDHSEDSRPNWDTWFITLCFVIAQRSLDPHTKHGCVITDVERSILSIGYNGPPRNCNDRMIPLTRPDKYRYMEHSEANAIDNAARSGTPLRNSKIYVTGMPCCSCIRSIINSGIKTVVYGPVTSVCKDSLDMIAVNQMVSDTKIEMIEFNDMKSVKNLLNMALQYIDNKFPNCE